MSALAFFDYADQLPFPSTPEEMCILLEIEDQAKREHGLTHRGINGYVYLGAERHTVQIGEFSWA